jgi:hypothetical protein
VLAGGLVTSLPAGGLGVSDTLLQEDPSFWRPGPGCPRTCWWGRRREGTPQLPDGLDRLDAALGASRFRYEFLLEPGDLLFVDHHRIAHHRTADVEGPGRPRIRLRLG